PKRLETRRSTSPAASPPSVRVDPGEDIAGVRRALVTNLRERGEMDRQQGRAVGGLAQGSRIRLWPASGAPTCCISPPSRRPPTSTTKKPASPNSATTSDLASPSSPDRKITRCPP